MGYRIGALGPIIGLGNGMDCHIVVCGAYLWPYETIFFRRLCALCGDYTVNDGFNVGRGLLLSKSMDAARCNGGCWHCGLCGAKRGLGISCSTGSFAISE